MAFLFFHLLLYLLLILVLIFHPYVIPLIVDSFPVEEHLLVTFQKLCLADISSVAFSI